MEFYISNGIHARARQRLRLNVIGRYHCTKKHPLSSSLKIFTIKKLAIVLHGRVITVQLFVCRHSG